MNVKRLRFLCVEIYKAIKFYETDFEFRETSRSVCEK